MPLLLANPWVLLGVVVGLLTYGGTMFGWGHHQAKKSCLIEKAELRELSIKQQQAELGKAITVATTLEVKRADQRAKFNEFRKGVDRVVEKPAYRDLCFDADGLLLANAALAGKGATPAKPDAAVPRPHAP